MVPEVRVPPNPTRLVLLDSSIVRDVTEGRRGLDARQLLSAVAGGARGARYRFVVFRDELQSWHVEQLAKLFRTVIELFARDLKVLSYGAGKAGYHERCGDLVRAAKRAFGLREDENCKREVESDAFLLIVACAMMRSYAGVTIVTSDEMACQTLRLAVDNPSFTGKIEVLCL